jgi:hypothetical protein
VESNRDAAVTVLMDSIALIVVANSAMTVETFSIVRKKGVEKQDAPSAWSSTASQSAINATMPTVETDASRTIARIARNITVTTVANHIIVWYAVRLPATVVA